MFPKVNNALATKGVATVGEYFMGRRAIEANGADLGTGLSHWWWWWWKRRDGV